MDLVQEQKLILLCKEDLSHFTEIYDAYISDVYRYCYSKLGNKSEAEDLTSETFLIALEKITNFQLIEGKSIKCWLFVIARNLILSRYRKKETVEFNDDYTAFSDENILEATISKDMIKRVEDYIKEFKPPVPEIIQLRVWEEMTFDQIAEVLGKNTAAVKVAYYRALEKINTEFVEKGVEYYG